jgi:hypothetical protein
MGSRWYNPANGDFGNKDTAANNPVPASASASPYAYAADNPLTGTDPTGHFPCLSATCLVNDVTSAAPALIDAVVHMGGRISFSLQEVDVENVIAGIGEGWTDEELRYIAGNPAARPITTFFHGSVPF